MQSTEYKRTILDDVEDKGIAQGMAKGKAEDVLHLLDRRGLALTDEQRAAVTACTDTAQLDTWFDRAITAVNAAEVFAE
jgi:hypothetical protein